MSTQPSPGVPSRGLGPRVAAVLGVFAMLLGTLLVFVRPWYVSWGATAEEFSGRLPGDELSTGLARQTRAIEIAAPAAQVFAWVSQLGQNRAGFYSYSMLENLVGCEMPDIRQLDPALQHWSVGDKLWMYPSDELGGMGHATLLYHEPGRALVFGTQTPGDPSAAAPTGLWSLVVMPTGPRSSRLLTRAKGGELPSLLGRAYTRALFEPLHYAMERRMLEGIKGLAEGHPISRASDALQLFAWFTTFGYFLASAALVLAGSRPRRCLVAFAASGIAFQIVTLRQPLPFISLSLVLALTLLLWPLPRERAAPALIHPLA